jgi:hypothetical protein
MELANVLLAKMVSHGQWDTLHVMTALLGSIRITVYSMDTAMEMDLGPVEIVFLVCFPTLTNPLLAVLVQQVCSNQVLANPFVISVKRENTLQTLVGPTVQLVPWVPGQLEMAPQLVLTVRRVHSVTGLEIAPLVLQEPGQPVFRTPLVVLVLLEMDCQSMEKDVNHALQDFGL